MLHYRSLLLFMLLIHGCKNEKPLDELRLINYEIEKNDIYLELEMIVPEDDRFSVFYTEDGTFNYSGNKMVVKEVKGLNKPQKIVFNFPDNSKPTAIRVDIGQNPKQKTITFKKYVFNYYDKKLIIKDSLSYYYGLNSYFTFNTVKNTFVPTTNKENYDPILYCKPEFAVKLKEHIYN